MINRNRVCVFRTPIETRQNVKVQEDVFFGTLVNLVLGFKSVCGTRNTNANDTKKSKIHRPFFISIYLSMDGQLTGR